jgi:gamma-glutamyltranspeptidase/glutathione hydrolase
MNQVMMRAGLMFLALALILVAAGPGRAAPAGVRAERQMVVTANRHASQAGLEMLRAGGSAVDAAIAAQLVLGLVEPQSSGLGGGAFMLHFAAGSGVLSAYDGRETAPAAVDERLFLDAQGQPMRFFDAVAGGRAVGAPGVVRMLALAHKEHGRLPWAALFAPALRLAEAGFRVSPRLHFLIARDRLLKNFSAARSYFYKDGAALPEGFLLKNPAYAQSLRQIAADPQAFYRGPLARQIIDAVRHAERNPGMLSLADLAAYRAKKRPPVCLSYRLWRLCGMPPPSSGGVTTLQIMKMLERFDMAAIAPGSLRAVHLISAASRLAFADRAAYLADSDFVAVPVRGLLDADYLRARAALIDPARRLKTVLPGAPRYDDGAPADFFAAPSPERPSTSHLSIVDRWGDVVSMTTSVENVFGSRVMVGGFLLNNQLTDFSFVPRKAGAPVANRVEPGKRPRSSMSPTIVFDRAGRPVMAIGSPGGPAIIGFVVKTLIGVLDWKRDIQAAIALPNHVTMGGPLFLERATPLVGLGSGLKALGYKVRERSLVSGLHGVVIRHGPGRARRLTGGADPRREGVALGD